MKPTQIAQLLAGISLAASGSAGAAGFELLQQSASSLGTAFAGTAAGEDASAVFFNPGALIALPARQFSIGGVAQKGSAEFSDRGSPGLNGNNGGDAGGWVSTGNAYLALRLGSRVSAGIGVNSPFGMNLNHDAGWIGATEALKTRISSVAVTPAIAFELKPGLSVGLGVTAQKLTGEISAMEGAAPFTRLSFEGDETAWGGSYGVLWQVSPRMRLGVSYRSAFKHELSGNLDRTAGAGSGPARMTVKTPDVATISVAHQLNDKWLMLGDLAKTGWKRLQEFNLSYANGTFVRSEPLLLHNSMRVSLGGVYRWNDDLKIKMGAGYERTPTTDGNRLARLPDERRFLMSLGAQYRLFKDATLDIAYSHAFVSDAGIEKSPNSPGALNGTYETSADTFGVQYTQGF